MAQAFFGLKIEGAKELREALLELPKRIAKDAVRRALRKAADPIAQEAKSLAPVKTGKLRDRIAVSSTLSRRQRRQRRKQGEVEIFIGAGPSRQAHLIEFGTGPRYQRNGKYVGQIAPRPFLRPAWEGGKRQALETFSKLLWTEIEAAAKRAARKAAKAQKIA